MSEEVFNRKKRINYLAVVLSMLPSAFIFRGEFIFGVICFVISLVLLVSIQRFKEIDGLKLAAMKTLFVGVVATTLSKLYFPENEGMIFGAWILFVAIQLFPIAFDLDASRKSG